MKGFNEFLEKYQNEKVSELPNSVTNKPLVSVIVMAYNHELYIEQCLNSILDQKTNFDYEIILGEDESADRTRDICKLIANSNQEKVRLFFHSRKNNIKIEGKSTGRFNFLYSLYKVQAKYIALCDGDDYWTDPLKLQKQVDFLEENEEYIFHFHNVNFKESGKAQGLYLKGSSSLKPKTYTLQDLLFSNFIPTCSVVFRNDINKELYQSERFLNLKAGDRGLWIMLLEQGDSYYSPEVMASKNNHQGGVFHGLSLLEKEIFRLGTWKTLNELTLRKYNEEYKKMILKTTYNIADIYYTQNNYSLALKYLKKVVMENWTKCFSFKILLMGLKIYISKIVFSLFNINLRSLLKK